MRCEEIMTRDPASLPIEATVLEAARLMAEKDIGFVPLVDSSGRAIGTVTDRDIVVNCVAKGQDCKTAKLKDFGGNEVISVLPRDEVRKAKELMAKHQIQRILVCDEQKKPLGVISLQDLTEKQPAEDVGATVREVKEGSPQPIH